MMLRSCKTISLFLVLSLISPIRSQSSEESKEKDGSEAKSYHDMFNQIEDGGYDEQFFVVYDYSQGQAGEIDTVLHLDLSITEEDGDYPAPHYDEVRGSLEEFEPFWSLVSSSPEEMEDTGPVLRDLARDQITQVDYDYDKSTEIS